MRIRSLESVCKQFYSFCEFEAQCVECVYMHVYILPSHLSLKHIYIYIYNNTMYVPRLVFLTWVVFIPYLSLDLHVYTCTCTLFYKEKRKKHARSNKQTRQSNTAPQNKLPRVGLEPMTLYSRQRALPLSYQGSSAGWAQISHFIVHQKNRLTINSV